MNRPNTRSNTRNNQTHTLNNSSSPQTSTASVSVDSVPVEPESNQDKDKLQHELDPGGHVDDPSSNKKTGDMHACENVELTIECSVCLQPCIYPVQLPCKHIFCFLCVKGVANRSKKCALCRQDIPTDFFAKPVLVRDEDLEKTIKFDDEYQWYYEGRNGWWKYDDRTSQEIEIRHKSGEKVFELLIAGFLYIIDLDNMVQFRRNDRSRKRKMKRDLITIPDVKGVAGLKFSNEISNRLGGDGGEEDTQSNVVPIQLASSPDDNVPNITPNTPVDSPSSSVTSSQQDLTDQLHQLNLSESTSL